MNFHSSQNFCRARMAVSLAGCAVILFASRPIAAQNPQPQIQLPPRAESRRAPFRAVHYDVNVAVLPEKQAITTRAKIEFEAREASANVELELHQDLRVQTVSGEDGKPLSFDRYPESPLRLTVHLPQTVVAGQHITLTFDYAGPLANDDASPVKGVRLAYVSEASTLLLLPGRWFPLTDYPANRYTGVFNIAVPESMIVVGTGEALPPEKRTVMFESEPTGGKPGVAKPKAPPSTAAAPAGSTTRMVYTFRWTKPQPGGTFVAGKWQSQTAPSADLPITVAAPALAPGTADAFSQQLSAIIPFFSNEFGALPEPGLRVAQIPAGGLAGYSAPGLLLVGARQWDPRINYRLLAQLAAGQWFGNEVTPASPNDVWVTDGLSRYAEGLYVENAAGREALDRVLEDWSVGALMFEQSSPIAQAGQLTPFTPEYRSVVQNKGAMVFYMLRSQMGDARFRAALYDLHDKFAGRAARIEDFEKLAKDRAAPATRKDPALNLMPFFTQWLNSTGVPEFKLDYVVVRTRKGFLLRGNVKQDLETFRMPVEIRVATEGNPETQTIDVVGTKSDFTIETFGRPRPNGVTIDPNNNLLKSSPKLRVRALIGRGEEIAQRGDFYEAIQEYQRALDVQRNSSLAHFRMAEAAFYQRNYQAAAGEFREALSGDLEPKWVEVWSHLYLGKIFDIGGSRERAVNEYSKARDARDDTGGAQAEVAKYLAQPYKPEGETSRATP